MNDLAYTPSQSLSAERATMSLEDIGYLRAVLDGLAQAVVQFGPPIPPAVRRARGILDTALATPEPPEFNADNLISTREVAKLLRVNRRTVQRKAKELGGKWISGRLAFDRDEILAEREVTA